MSQVNISLLKAGAVAYVVALCVILGAGPLMYIAYRLGARLSRANSLLLSGNRATAIVLGSTSICQAILIRHAVFAVIEVVRSLFLYEFTSLEAVWLLARCGVIFIIVAATALVSVYVVSLMFTKLTRGIQEEREIAQDNVAVAIFWALNLLAITLVLDSGMQEFARSLIPFGRSGSLG